MNKDYIFNTLAGLINAVEAVVMSMIITRTTGLTDASYVITAFAVGNLVITIGKYGIYNFQVTDNKAEFTFHTYFCTRCITTMTMLVSLLIYIIYGKCTLSYNNKKMMIVLFVGLIYVIESLEDFIRAHCQYMGELYLGSLMFIIRWMLIIFSFSIAICYTKNSCTALGISLCISVVFFIVCCYVFSKRYFKIKNKSEYNQTESAHFDLLIKCFPLFFSSFLSSFISNLPKYAVERYMDGVSLACYGFVGMPVSVIGLLNSFIYIPQLVSMTSDYRAHNIKQFKKRIFRQYIIIVLLTMLSIIGAYLIGIRILSLLYHTDLHDYCKEFLILMLSGGFLALSGYQSSVLTIMRQQKVLLYGYIPITILALLFVNISVKTYGTVGAASSYLILIIILSILYEIFIHIKLRL